MIQFIIYQDEIDVLEFYVERTAINLKNIDEVLFVIKEWVNQINSYSIRIDKTYSDNKYKIEIKNKVTVVLPKFTSAINSLERVKINLLKEFKSNQTQLVVLKYFITQNIEILDLQPKYASHILDIINTIVKVNL